MILDKKPVADVLTPLAVDRQRLARQRVEDRHRHQLLGEVERTVIVGTIADHDRQTIGLVPRPDKMVRGGLGRRIGAGYEWQHKSGFFIGSGVEYQDFHEQVDKEKKWVYTKSNATQVGTDTYQQNIPVVINTGFGTTSATLRVDIEENSVTTDYQEGDQVSFRLTVDHSLKWLRVPVYVGYHYEWRNWFAEVRGGMGLQVFLASNSTITEVLEARDKIKIRETESTKQLKHLQKTIWDAQGGLYAGYRFSDAWSASLGYEQWFSLQSVVDRPNVSTKTNGSGVQLALRRTF